MPPEVLYWLTILFAAAFGGSIGSFLNVVVYRLPNKLSLIWPPSHCPICKNPIPWHDNLPVVGWLMLRGKCRNCGCWIPIRYPAVEALTAVMFAALAAVEKPLQPVYPDHLILLCYHLLLLCTLLCSALIEIDGNRPPLRLFVPALIVGIAAPLLWPPLAQLAVLPGLHPTGVVHAIDIVAGAVAGVAVCGLLWALILLWRRRRPQDESNAAPPFTGLLLGLICVGTFLGWQALIVLVAVTLAAHGMLRFPSRYPAKARVPPSVWLLVGAVVWLII